MKLFVVAISVTVAFTISIVNSKAILFRSPKSEPPVSVADDTYTKFCAQCHGMDGRAKTAKGKRAGATDFTGTDWNTDEARALRIITNGKGEMPSFKNKLTGKEIRSVWGRVRRFRE